MKSFRNQSCIGTIKYAVFGAIRNVETLEWIGPSPVFDSGTSLWHNKLTRAIQPLNEVESKSFYAKAAKQMQ